MSQSNPGQGVNPRGSAGRPSVIQDSWVPGRPALEMSDAVTPSCAAAPPHVLRTSVRPSTVRGNEGIQQRMQVGVDLLDGLPGFEHARACVDHGVDHVRLLVQGKAGGQSGKGGAHGMGTLGYEVHVGQCVGKDSVGLGGGVGHGTGDALGPAGEDVCDEFLQQVLAASSRAVRPNPSRARQAAGRLAPGPYCAKAPIRGMMEK